MRRFLESHGLPRQAARKDAGPMHVLLIEDDALMRRMLSDMLSEDGIEVDGLASAEDALILLGAGQVPDVLVTDINLGPGLSGLDLAAIARERHPDLELVLISGMPLDTGAHPLARHERFLQKPFPPHALADAIRSAADALRTGEGDPAPAQAESPGRGN
ncbi:MAG: response regulator [Acetobacteraceae bacterium]|nr:response regulator [Acetobacteraceae bacterium]